MTGRFVAREKSRAFALRVVKGCQYLRSRKREYVLSKQLLRSGTAIGALVREAEYAESRPDFVHKMHMALKEANETDYWIDLLLEAGYFAPEVGRSLQADCRELLRILIAIIKTTKSQ
ncbi:MAG: four helix bundle protein [Alcanivorax sp.]|jgi:four helix bundle protein|nr:MAG: four helix bundle protein [Alcanivorax sp.]|tara:strand:- start:730 stop:1083 length:354 start_codon:yes stop_codon:yes gene_type:complete